MELRDPCRRRYPRASEPPNPIAIRRCPVRDHGREQARSIRRSEPEVGGPKHRGTEEAQRWRAHQEVGGRSDDGGLESERYGRHGAGAECDTTWALDHGALGPLSKLETICGELATACLHPDPPAQHQALKVGVDLDAISTEIDLLLTLTTRPAGSPMGGLRQCVVPMTSSNDPIRRQPERASSR